MLGSAKRPVPARRTATPGRGPRTLRFPPGAADRGSGLGRQRSHVAALSHRASAGLGTVTCSGAATRLVWQELWSVQNGGPRTQALWPQRGSCLGAGLGDGGRGAGPARTLSACPGCPRSRRPGHRALRTSPTLQASRPASASATLEPGSKPRPARVSSSGSVALARRGPSRAETGRSTSRG